jgi:hypothetical protein
MTVPPPPMSAPPSTEPHRRGRHPAGGIPSVRLARLGWGAVLLVAPDRVLAVGLGRPRPPAHQRGQRRYRGARRVLRVLGGRHLAQAVLQTAAERVLAPPAVGFLGSAVDGIHALTSVVFGAIEPRWRRAALLDAVMASGFAAATAGAAACAAAGRART